MLLVALSSRVHGSPSSNLSLLSNPSFSLSTISLDAASLDTWLILFRHLRRIQNIAKNTLLIFLVCWFVSLSYPVVYNSFLWHSLSIYLCACVCRTISCFNEQWREIKMNTTNSEILVDYRCIEWRIGLSLSLLVVRGEWIFNWCRKSERIRVDFLINPFNPSDCLPRKPKLRLSFVQIKQGLCHLVHPRSSSSTAIIANIRSTEHDWKAIWQSSKFRKQIPWLCP